jgi:predicted metal-dependent HD superfamily phosphohydrolase
MSDLDELAHEWQQCWHSQLVRLDDRQQIYLSFTEVFQRLVTAYTQPDRYYHNLTHIHHVLDLLDRFSNSALVKDSQRLQDPVAVCLAAWFHDFVYDTQSSDSEVQSANAARRLLRGCLKTLDMV